MIACLLISDLVMHIEGRQPERIGKPIILTTGTGTVQAASSEAVRQGVQVGMRKRQAHNFCPSARVVPLDDAPYKEITEAIGDMLQDFTSKIELARGFWKHTKKKPTVFIHPSGAIYYLDLGKLKRTEGLSLVDQLQKTMLTTFGLPVCIGLASNKFTAGVAVRFAKPNSPKLVRLGFERHYLARLSVNLLPLDKEISRRLHILGIHTIGAFATLPIDEVLNQFGKDGRFLHQLAQGIDTRPVTIRARKPREQVRKVLDGVVEDKTTIEAILQLIGCEIEQRLKALNFMTSQLEMSLHLDDGKITHAKRVLREATANGKLIGRNLLRLFAPLELSSGVVEIQVTALALHTPVMQQMDLFGTPSISENRLGDLLEKITSRFGNDGLIHIRELEPTHWLPEHRYRFEKLEAEVA